MPLRQSDGKYLTAGIYYLFGNIIGQGVILLSATIFTRLMSKEAYGLVNTYAAWVLVLNTFIGLNLFVTVRNAYIDYREDYHKYTSSVLLFSLWIYIFFTVAILGVTVLLKIKVDHVIIFLATVQAISVHTINYRMAVLSMENKYKLRTMYMVFPNILHTFLSIIFIIAYASNPYYEKVIGNVIGLLLFALVIIVHEFWCEKPKFNKEYWSYGASIAVPGIMLTLSDLLLMQSDRIMLTNMAGADETAVYSLVYNIGSILIALYTAINGAWTPWFYTNVAKKNEKSIKKMAANYIKLFTIAAIGLLTISPEIVKILSPVSYWNGISYVNLIIFASFLIFIYAFFTNYLMYLKKPGIIAKNTIIAAVLNLLLNYLLIPQCGALGAAIATLISYIILFLMHYISVTRHGRSLFDKRRIWFAIGELATYSIIFHWIQGNWIIRYLIVIFLVVIAGKVMWKNRKENKANQEGN